MALKDWYLGFYWPALFFSF